MSDIAFEQFTGKYSLSKTLRFKLEPIGKTQDYIDKRGLLETDEKLARDYEAMKDYIDDYHRYFIQDILSRAEVDWTDLAECLQAVRTVDPTELEEISKKISQANTNYRKQIAELFSSDDRFEELFKSGIITKLLPDYFGGLNDTTAVETIERFKDFTVYFRGLGENRSNIYSKEEQATAISYRVVHDNFPKFLTNITTLKKVYEYCPHILDEVDTNLRSYLDYGAVDDYFTINGFNQVLTQDGIDTYNQILGGVVQDEHVQGLNQLLNLAYQAGTIPGRYRMIPLYKQILSDRNSLSFSIEAFSSDDELIDAINTFSNIILSDNPSALEKIARISETTAFNLDEVFIASKKEHQLSKVICLNHASVSFALDECAEKCLGPVKGYRKRATKEWRSKKFFSIREVIDALDATGETYSLERLAESTGTALENTRESYTRYVQSCQGLKQGNRVLPQDEERIEVIKTYLDACMACRSFLELFTMPEAIDIESNFYADHSEAASSFETLVPLYNKTRNYLTQKPYSDYKFQLFFGNTQLLDGWDINKEEDDLCTLLRKDGRYYLGLFYEKTSAREMAELTDAVGGDIYEKMVYKQIPGASKYLSSKQILPQKPPLDIKMILEKKKAGKSPLNQAEIERFIDYCQNDFLINYDKIRDPKTGKCYFDFNFKKPAEYKTLNDFFSDVENQAYAIRFRLLSAHDVDRMVEEGKLYLFEFANKDFSLSSSGAKNLHTLYFDMLFDERNLKDLTLRLSGGAELNYRPASIEEPIVHDKGSILVNRTYVSADGIRQSIPEENYKEIVAFVNGRCDIDSLSKHTKELWESGLIQSRPAPHVITKDRRFSKAQYTLHFPIKINAQAPKYSYIDREMREYLLDNPSVNLIGIDRGERNLLYVSVIDRNGNILLQKSLNVLNGVDFQARLDSLEKSRASARKEWKSIKGIRNAKEGYLSLAVRDIAQLMIDYNAIIIMEDLNFGFKRGRFKVEKQVYQKFERQLIEKLNYFAMKPGTGPSHRMPEEIGGLLHGYQLTPKFDSFHKLGKQSGAIFYVPAWDTSKIDPATGFVNLFRNLNYKNVEEAKSFFGNMDRIRYNDDKEYFEFSFRYSKFETVCKPYKDEWTVCSQGSKRIITHPKTEEGIRTFISEVVDVTSNLKALFTSHGIEFDLCKDLTKSLLAIDDASFWSSLIYNFKALMQLRYSSPQTSQDCEDYILSPVVDSKGCFFDSRRGDKNLPVDADANGAYNIALKGLMMIGTQFERNDDGSVNISKPKDSRAAWIRYAQDRNL